MKKLNLNQAGVYLLHFHDPICPTSPTRHYIGYAANIRRRVAMHRNRPDARLLQVALERGIGFEVARIWAGADRTGERYLKSRRDGGSLCPVCNPKALQWAIKAEPVRRRRAQAAGEEIPF